MAKFTMLIGIPASGKSSYARGLSSEPSYENAPTRR